MKRLFKIRKGLDINLKGVAEKSISKTLTSKEYAISPIDFHGFVPRILAKEGTHVDAGTPVFTDKATERINIVSPVSGTIKSIVRGERRKILHAIVEADDKSTNVDFGKIDLNNISRENLSDLLLKSGLFAFFRQRPYDVVANPDDEPKAIFVSTFSKMPLAADFTYVVEGLESTFKTGISALSKLASVYVGISPEQINTDIMPIHDAEVSVFNGPNPSGNVGVHINKISPINKGEVVWTIGAEEVIFIGRLIETGKVDLTRRIAIAGSGIQTPQYVETLIGAPVADLIDGNVNKTEKHQRIIDGNPLVGRKSSMNGYLGAHTTEVCVIPEGDDVDEVLGWIMPRFNDFSTNKSYFSWLYGKNKQYDLDCRIKGGERHMIMSSEYERVFPMDIYPSYLIKAIITGDIDRQEELGIYEVAPEDFAVAEFICSSKLELQKIVREGLDILRKENA